MLRIVHQRTKNKEQLSSFKYHTGYSNRRWCRPNQQSTIIPKALPDLCRPFPLLSQPCQGVQRKDWISLLHCWSSLADLGRTKSKMATGGHWSGRRVLKQKVFWTSKKVVENYSLCLRFQAMMHHFCINLQGRLVIYNLMLIFRTKHFVRRPAFSYLNRQPKCPLVTKWVGNRAWSTDQHWLTNTFDVPPPSKDITKFRGSKYPT